jgi:hypothetical protein
MPHRKSRKEPVIPTLPYAAVETALAQVYGAEHVQKGIFRGRLKNFRKIGIPRVKPGRGSRIRYSMTDVYQLLFSLEIAEFGVDPSLIVKMVCHHWDVTREFPVAIAKASEPSGPGDDVWIAIPANFMSWIWGEKLEKSETGISYRSGSSHPVWLVRDFQESKASDFLKATRGRRVLTFNLSARLRDLKKALEEDVL